MKMEGMAKCMQEALMASFGDAKWHIFARLLTDEEAENLDPQCVTVTCVSRLYVLVADCQRVCRNGSVIVDVTYDLLDSWQITVEEAAYWACANMEREAGYGFRLSEHSSADVCDGRLLMYGIRFRSTLAARYAAGILSSVVTLQQVGSQLGPFNVYIFGADETSLYFCRAADMEGIDTGTPLWWDRCYPPKVSGPVPRFDGEQICPCDFDMSVTPPKNYPPRERAVLIESLIDYT